MKKTITEIVLILFLIFNAQNLFSQTRILQPKNWKNYTDTCNLNLIDTFLVQRFENTPEENWFPTRKTKKVSYIDASKENIKGQEGSFCCKIPLDESISFSVHGYNLYKNVKTNIFFAAKDINKGDTFFLDFIKSTESELKNYPLLAVNNGTNTLLDFGKTLEENSGKSSNPILLTSPLFLSFRAKKSSTSSQNGSFYLDNLYTFGTIKQTTFFSGVGKWNDSTRWNYYPAARNRYALINGDITVTQSQKCRQASISKKLIINPSGSLNLQRLKLFPNSEVVNLGGSLKVDSIIIYKDFDKKGFWYFVSFPFDVYREGIDKKIQLTSLKNVSGNYLYAYKYDGNRRYSLQKNTNNYILIDPNKIPPNEPIFKKGIGYLLAIDANADFSQYSFSSKNNISDEFGYSGTIPISIYSNNKEIKNIHQGWCLCGNPFPSNMLLSQISNPEITDGYIYVYNGKTFTPYDIYSNYSIAPYSAFFIRAKQTGTLELKPHKKFEERGKKIPTSQALSLPIPPEENLELSPNTNTKIYSENKSLYIKNLPYKSKINIYNKRGQLLQQKVLPSGNSKIEITHPVHLIFVEIRNIKTTKKILLHY